MKKRVWWYDKITASHILIYNILFEEYYIFNTRNYDTEIIKK